MMEPTIIFFRTINKNMTILAKIVKEDSVNKISTIVILCLLITNDNHDGRAW